MSTVDNTNIVGTKTGPELVTELNTQIGNTDTELDLRPEAGANETITGDWSFTDITAVGRVYGGNTTLTVDNQFYMGASNATTPKIEFDAGDRIEYSRAGNFFSFYIDNVAQFNLSDSVGDFVGIGVKVGESLKIKERAAAAANSGGFGQLWVKNDATQTLWFTDESGVSTQLGTGGGGLGITDDATAERLLIEDGQITVGTSGADTVIARKDSTNALILSAGTSSADGPYLKLDGATNDILVRGGTATNRLFGDWSKWAWTFDGSIACEGGVWGADAAKSLKLLAHCSSTSTDSLTPYGAWIELFAHDHAGTPNRISFNAGGEEVLLWGEIQDTWNFKGKVVSGLSELKFSERADHISTPNSTSGHVWVRNDTPNKLIYTDDAGTDWVLNAASGSGDLKADGTVPLTADWDVGGFGLENVNAVYNNQTGTTYTIVAADNGKIITFNNAASIAVTLPDTLATNFQCTIVQVGAGVPTVTPNTDTINGAGTGVAPSAQWKGMYLSQYSATNWLALL